MCLFITAFAVASSMFAIQFGSLHGFLQQVDGPIDYIYRNATLIILQQNIGNLMSSYPSPETINGSLWTLAWEFNCYICVGVFGIFTVFRFPKLGPLVVALLIAANRYLESGAHNPILIGLIPSIGLFVLFGLGSSAYLFRHKIPMHWGIALVALIVGALALPTELCREVVPICVAYLALYGAMYIPVRSFDRRIDLSYGVYLYGTPVAKLAVLLGLPTVGFPTFYPIVMVVVVALATGSWYFVERPAMRLRSARFNLRSVFLSEA
jgi:peptidoglycan/LPS O-acetylase OafA/YrhL